MARKWTEAQSAAINTRNKTLLVSAAAGSGKTAALTERIIRSLTDKDSPADIGNMLIVTFTRAAAAELRQRIFSSLSDALADSPDNRHLCDQLIKISSAKICTIDSFYLDIIRTNFDKLAISPSFRTADSAELDVLARSVMEDAVDAFYESRGDDFSQIAECFVGLRSSSRLSEIFLDLYSKTESLPEGIEFIKNSALVTEKSAAGDFFDTVYGEIIRKSLLEESEYYLSALNEYCRIIADDEKISAAYLSAFAYDRAFTQKLCERLKNGNYAACREHILSYSPQKLGSLKKEFKNDFTDECTNTRNKLKDRLKSLREKTFAPSSQSLCELMYKTAHVTSALYDLLADFDKRFSDEKKQRNICSFADIRRLALTLLVDDAGKPTPTALEYAERYTDIYIDEYQDVDRVQDMIFKAISKPTSRFMVGDIKQSIYSFRGAEPQVFAEYRKAFPDISKSADSPSCSIFMSNNFRCDSTVIDFTNAVCSFVFSECSESMGYTRADDLVYSKIVEDRKADEAPVEVAILVPSDEDEEDTDDEAKKEDNKTLEARYIAHRIQELLECGKKADGTKILPHDIAVLFRTKTMGTYVKKALGEAGILCSDNTDENYFENPDVLLVLCLLNAIDNPQRDIYLAGILRSPIFDFSLDELIEIKYSADRSLSLYDALCLYKEGDSPLAEKCRSFDATLSELRDISTSLTVDKLLRHIFSSELFAANGLVNSNDGNNLIRLYEYARKFEAGSFKGLYNFIVYINKIIEEGTKIEGTSGEASEGRVTLMTIHQSKGLEFPVCFLCNAGGSFNTQETRESLIFEPSAGLAMKIADRTGLARVNTPMRQALLSVGEAKQTEEEMRILYVALTRARERLIVTASSRKSCDALQKKAAHDRKFKNRFTVCSAHSYIEWILAAADTAQTANFCNVQWIDKKTVSNISLCSEKDPLSEPEVEADNRLREKLCERFSYVYPYEAATRLPAKVSVSTIISGADGDNSDDGVTELFKTEEEYLAPPIFSEITKDSALSAKRGTATHLFMQFCDFENAEKNGVEAELCRLIEKRFVPENTAELVYVDELESFFRSDLYGMIKNAKRIIREQRFNILLSPTLLDSDPDFAKQTAGEFLAVQGVIDLIIEDSDGNIILCDYKTDRLTRSELADKEQLLKKMSDRHGKQLKYYVDAIQQLFSKSCAKTLIYSTHAGYSVEIDT